MKIAMPVNDKSMKASISDTFGRTQFFLIYNTESQDCLYVDNSAAASQGGAGIKAAQLVIDHKVEALLTPQCGENAVKVLQPGGVRIYKTTYISVMDNIVAFSKGELALIDHIYGGGQGGFHGGHGGR